MSDVTKILQTGGDAAGDVSQYPTPVTIVDADGNPVELGGGSTPAAPADGSVTTAKIAAGAVTPAKLASYDGGTGHGKVPMVKSDGTGFDFVDLPVVPAAPGAATTAAAGLVKQAAFVADPAGDTVSKAEYIALRNALVAAGAMASK